jgi:5-amino-6-(5-phospho-D-ribitylamino)uracil phosphatase
VTDLDRTLLRSDKTISNYTKEVLTRCRENGIKIAFATARYFRTIQEWLIPAIGITPDIVISSNGAYAYGGSDVYYKSLFHAEIGNRLTEQARAMGGSVTVGTSKMRYSESPIAKTHATFSIPYDFSVDITDEFLYVDVHGLDDVALDYLAAAFPELLCERYIGENLATFVHKDAKKGFALSVITEKLGLPTHEIVGFGDDSNDIDFLSICGTKVAMSNAIDEVKTIANFICGSNDEDGVAKWLGEHVLEHHHWEGGTT